MYSSEYKCKNVDPKGYIKNCIYLVSLNTVSHTRVKVKVSVSTVFICDKHANMYNSDLMVNTDSNSKCKEEAK